MAESYSDVLASKNELTQVAYKILEFVQAATQSSLSSILSAIEASKQRIRMILGFFVYHGILIEQEEVYTVGDDTNADELIEKFLSDAKDADIPAATQEYYQQFAFSSFVSSVSKWINHDGVTEREYDIDRLWTGAYIDFLDKCREYIKWRKSDQAILKSKISKIKSQNGKKI